jgi:CheY-like chemotaxis protein
VISVRSGGVTERLVPGVFRGAEHDHRDQAFCYAAGANAYHVKPVRYPEHLQLVIDLLTYWIDRVALPGPAGAAS